LVELLEKKQPQDSSRERRSEQYLEKYLEKYSEQEKELQMADWREFEKVLW